MIIRSIDFETSGTMGPHDDQPDDIVEVGWCDILTELIDEHATTVVAGGHTSLLVAPVRGITPQARGVHHIKDEQLQDAVLRREAILTMATDGSQDGTVPVFAFAAHQAEHERSLWSTEKRPWICTRKAAMRIWPMAPDHKLQTLRYWLPLDQVADDLAWPPHRAGPDAYVGAHLLAHILRNRLATVDQLVSWTEVPSLLPVCTLKKHKGKTWEQVSEDDPGYLDWMLKQDDMDADLQFTARHWLDARKPRNRYDEHGPNVKDADGLNPKGGRW